MEYGACTHPGKVRKNNEDYFYIPEKPDDVQRIIIVADGMGGHNAGDVASFIGVNSVIDSIKRMMNDHKSVMSVKDMVYLSLSSANSEIYRMSQSDEKYQGMGTTMTMTMFDENEAVIGHVGDSRAYLLRENKLQQLTQDHSLVEELVKNGSITKDEAMHHPQKHIITRAIGTEEKVKIDIIKIEIKSDDLILLCSDGLSNYLDNDEIESVLKAGDTCSGVSKELVNMAVERGGNDNITVICCKVC